MKIQIMENRLNALNPMTTDFSKEIHKPRKQKVQYTSIIAYIANLPKVGKRYREIILIFKNYKFPMNNQMVLREMRKFYPSIEISSICGRTNELRKSKSRNRTFPILIKCLNKSLCPITGELTDFYKLNQSLQEVLA